MSGWKNAVTFNYIVYFALSVQCGFAIFASFIMVLRKAAKIINAISVIFHLVAIIWVYVAGFNANARKCSEQDTGELG